VRARIAEEREEAPQTVTTVTAPTPEVVKPPTNPQNEVGQFVSPEQATVNGVKERLGVELMQQVVLLPGEVARVLRIEEDDVMTLARRGELASVRVGKQKRFLRIDLMRYLIGQRNLSQSRD
jgi:excisionase family DNA binding protein